MTYILFFYHCQLYVKSLIINYAHLYLISMTSCMTVEAVFIDFFLMSFYSCFCYNRILFYFFSYLSARVSSFARPFYFIYYFVLFIFFLYILLTFPLDLPMNVIFPLVLKCRVFSLPCIVELPCPGFVSLCLILSIPVCFFFLFVNDAINRLFTISYPLLSSFPFNIYFPPPVWLSYYLLFILFFFTFISLHYFFLPFLSCFSFVPSSVYYYFPL